jgi:secondary thiamine-phosphate synthase enzyme
MTELTIRTGQHTEFVNITAQVQRAVAESGTKQGVCAVFVPHTTCGITINENADPDVTADIIAALERAVPWDAPYYRHNEGNSAAHVKASLMGSTVQVLVRDGQLQLGTWQAIYLCEFDGPRTRKVWVAMIR